MKDLDKFLNIAPDDVVDVSFPTAVSQQPHQSEIAENQIADDITFARDNLYDIINKGQEAVDAVYDIASRSQSTNDYTALSALINTLVNANKSLVELQKRKKELSKTEVVDSNNVTNNLFVGSTAELQKLIDNAKSNT
jgi:hypothetical protein